jgi:glycosyltransferase involved in cell wall biosynthesis
MTETNNLSFLLDQLSLKVSGGIGRYAENLFFSANRGIPDEWHIQGVSSDMELIENLNQKHSFDLNLSLRKPPVPANLLARFWQHGINIGSNSGPVFSPSLLAPYKKKSRPLTVTIHDLIPWQYPETLTRHGVEWHKKMLNNAFNSADAIAVPSQTIAEELDELMPFGDRIFVLPGASQLKREPLSKSDQELISGLPEKFFLIVGTLEPRKRIDIAVNAAKIAQDAPLIHVGPKGWGETSLEVFHSQSQTFPKTFLSLGYVSEPVLAFLYEKALALIAPSRAEGFGLPLIEAMKFGTPVICSDLPIFQETTRGSALFFEGEGMPASEQISELMKLIANKGFDEQKQKSLISIANNYSWESSAQILWEKITQISS